MIILKGKMCFYLNYRIVSALSSGSPNCCWTPSTVPPAPPGETVRGRFRTEWLEPYELTRFLLVRILHFITLSGGILWYTLAREGYWGIYGIGNSFFFFLFSFGRFTD